MAPAGTTHFNLTALAAEVDFEGESFVIDRQETGIQAWDDAARPQQVLTSHVTAASTHPLFLLLGIQFFQEVNGVNYPLKSGAFNALSIIKVSGA